MKRHINDWRAILNQHIEISIFSSSDEILMVAINKMLNALSDREREVLELRFGLKDGRQRTLLEVAEHFCVTRERIRQLESKALRKLRIEEYLTQLHDFVIAYFYEKGKQNPIRYPLREKLKKEKMQKSY